MAASSSPIQRVGRWEFACDLADGGRIGLLRFDGIDLLTTAPAAFRAPQGDFGRYETRPVYGYDDCFPTVTACDGWPDHGESCWLPWSGTATDATARSALAPLSLTRRLSFQPDRLRWSFLVQNETSAPLPVQHVMHPLMPLTAIDAIELPAGGDYDPRTVAADLLRQPGGTARMHYLHRVSEGVIRLGFRTRLWLTMRFPVALFPTIGIWWNNSGYPAESGLQRSECAFEPVPGLDSNLSHGTTLVVPAQGELGWSVDWEVVCR